MIDWLQVNSMWNAAPSLFELLMSPLSFAQFYTRCRKEWVSIKSSEDDEPVILCGSKLPKPLEFPGGNITVTHHFLPHQFPVSSFRLSYARGIAVPISLVKKISGIKHSFAFLQTVFFLFKGDLITHFMSLIAFCFCTCRFWWLPGRFFHVLRGPLPSPLLAL